jgi:hypothetical protein
MRDYKNIFIALTGVALLSFVLGYFSKPKENPMAFRPPQKDRQACKELTLQIDNLIPPLPLGTEKGSNISEFSVKENGIYCQLEAVIELTTESVINTWNQRPGINIKANDYQAFIERTEVHQAMAHYFRMDALTIVSGLAHQVVLPQNFSFNYVYEHKDKSLPSFNGVVLLSDFQFHAD